MIQLDGFAVQDAGKGRLTNEDAHLVDNARGLFAVCDGVSRNVGGDQAAQETIKAVLEGANQCADLFAQYKNDPNPEHRTRVLESIEDFVQLANQKVHQMQAGDPARAGMATTLSMVQIIGTTGFVAHAGDSRIYLIRGGKQHLLTEDHTFAAERVKKGAMTQDRAQRSPFAGILTRAIGLQSTVDLDLFTVELQTNDLLFLCTDGLSDHFRGQELLSMQKQNPETHTLVQKLAEWANARGGGDNVTVIGVSIKAPQNTSVDKIETLRSIPLFQHLTYRELNSLLAISKMRVQQPGELVFQEGAQGSEFFVILAGNVAVTKQGKQLATLKKGDFFGEMQMVEAAQRSATVTATSSMKLLVFSREDLFALLQREQGLAVKVFWEFCQVLNRRLRKTNELFVGKEEDTLSGIPGLPFRTGSET